MISETAHFPRICPRGLFFSENEPSRGTRIQNFLDKNKEKKNVIFEVKKEKKAANLHDNHFFVYFCR